MKLKWCEFQCGDCVPCIKALAAGVPMRVIPQVVETAVELAARERAVVTSRISTERGN